MCIALAPCAAGEGNAHPAETTRFSTDTTNLPWVILRAVHRAAQLDGISTRARAVLAALARTVDAQKPFGEIFARRTLLSERAMQSERTFYRSLADLEDAELIQRPPQRRYVEAGLFGRAYLHLTQKAAELLGLVEATPVVSAKPKEEDGGEAVAEGFAHPPVNVADGANTKDLSPNTFQKRQPGKVPQDLERLRTLGFLDFLIFKLMREARESGKRLSDVVEVCWPHLRLAKRPISYLRALLASSTDFGHQLRAKTQALIVAQALAQERDKALVAVQALDGHWFVAVDTGTRYTVTDAGATLMVYCGTEGVARRAAGQWATGFIAAISKGQIIKETLAPPTIRSTKKERFPDAVKGVSATAARILTANVSAHLNKLREMCRRP